MNLIILDIKNGIYKLYSRNWSHFKILVNKLRVNESGNMTL